jgi:hypothetical protein
VHKKIIWVAVRLPGERPGEQGDHQELPDVLAAAAEDGGRLAPSNAMPPGLLKP